MAEAVVGAGKGEYKGLGAWPPAGVQGQSPRLGIWGQGLQETEDFMHSECW